MIDILLSWWRKRQRTTDLTYLWPAIKNQTNNIEEAKAAFYQHCLIDDAWKDFGVLEIRDILESPGLLERAYNEPS